MFKELLKNKKMIGIFAIVIIFLLFVRRGGIRRAVENFENEGNVIDTIMNSFDTTGQKFNDVFTKIDATDVTFGKKIKSSKNIETTRDIKSKSAFLTGSAVIDGDVRAKRVVIEGQTLSKTDIMKIKSLKNIAGYAIDGGGSTHLLFEGYHKLHGSQKFDAWSNDKWDIIYIFKGWDFTAWKDYNKKSQMGTFKNTNEDAKRWKPDGNRLSEYEVKWVGY